MVEVLTYIYLFFIIASLYLIVLFLLLHYRNREELHENRIPKKLPRLSVLIPAYNEEENVSGTIQNVLDSDYPKNLMEIIVINDGSTDNTLKVIKRFKGIKIFDKKNTGKADSLNKALKIAKNDLIVIIDADSYPNKKAIKHMVGYFEEDNVGAVTSAILVRDRKTWIEKLQAIEYTIIAWNRKLLQFIEGIYVTPGPLSIYKKELLIKYGGFDVKNLTEDIEMTWRILSNGHKVRIDLNAKTYTAVPTKLNSWWKQRIRWFLGGLQTTVKYKKTLFNPSYGMMGLFVVPFFISSFALSFIGLMVFLYILSRKIFQSYLVTRYSYEAQSSFLRLDQLNLNANVFAFFFLLLIFFSVVFIFYSQISVERKRLKAREVPLYAVYLLIYLTLFPGVMMHSLIRWSRGKLEW